MTPPTSPAGYAHALERIAALLAAEGAEVDPRCRSQALLHGRPTAGVAVLLHGYTNCPRQFVPLGAQLHACGFNVLIPRLPHHGLIDRMSTAHAGLAAPALRAYAATALDIAGGLGQRVVVAGVSAGGVLAAWAAQERADVATALVIAPALGAALIPAWLTEPAIWLARRLPNQFRWWDDQLRERLPGPDYTYPRWATRTMAEIALLGRDVVRAAARRPPVARRVVLVSSACDQAVNPLLLRRLARRWAAYGATSYLFPAHMAVPHDCIDPHQPGQRVELVYPVLLAHLLAT